MIVLVACAIFNYPPFVTPTLDSISPKQTPSLTDTKTLVHTPTLIPASGIGSTWVRPKDGMVMVYVPEGEFSMGVNIDTSMEFCQQYRSDCQRDWFTSEEPVHSVYLEAYWIDRTEVTNEMYALCVNDGACNPPEHYAVIMQVDYYGDPRYANYPVIYVYWHYAETYCAWAEARLPTEAEWEKAARGTDGRTFPWGNTAPTVNLANYYETIGDLTEVGKYPSGASPYGALDLAGNVWEWVADWYDASIYSHSPVDNPGGPATGAERVIRGGGFVNMDYELRSTTRFGNDPDEADVAIGFRCAHSAASP